MVDASAGAVTSWWRSNCRILTAQISAEFAALMTAAQMSTPKMILRSAVGEARNHVA
jgi:hypothetical protein